MPKEAGDSDLDDSDGDSGLDDDIHFNAASNSSDGDEANLDDEDAEHSDVLTLAEGSDNDDLVGLDEDLPEGLVDYYGSDSEIVPSEEGWAGLFAGQKRKREGQKNDRRKKLRSLPTFASYEDYAKMIEEAPEDDT
jgi:ribosome biogenesis protein MAK21